MGKRPDPADVIRIELLDALDADVIDEEDLEGRYEWRHLKTRERLSPPELRGDLMRIFKDKDKVGLIMSRIENFRVVYVNKATLEVTT